MASDEERGTAFNPKRRLCPDGSCIGLIGSDGRCSVCGRSTMGRPGEAEPAAEAPPAAAPAMDDELDVEADEPAPPGSAFDPNRRLCSDGTCLGIIGQDHCCSVCGRPA